MKLEQSPPDLDISAIKAYFAQQPEVVLAYLFGSIARGEADSLSDIDIAVLLQPDLESEACVEKQLQFMLDLDKITKQDAQVMLLNQASPMLAYQTVRDRVLLYERNPQERANFEVLTMKRYFDVKPMLEFFNQARLRRIKEEGLGRRKQRPARALEAARRVHKRLTRISGR
jgi:predicted nucleotidyltransferase